ncbi:MAG: DUF1194 domain-containing protein [Geminicoccaceae bacterium]
MGGRWQALTAAAFAAGAAISWSASAAVRHVDIELVLAIDVSGSMDAGEQELQRAGLMAAFRDPAVIQAIKALPDGMAVALVAWAGVGEQRTIVEWRRLTDDGSSEDLAARVADALPVHLGSSAYTAIGDGLIWSLRELAINGFEGPARIDVSGDGHSNCGAYPQLVRDRAVAAGVTINGLAIENEEPQLADFYRRSVIGGPGAFVIAAADYQDFVEAIRLKLLRELAPGPMAARQRGGADTNP